MVRIKAVHPGSLGAELGLRPGFELLSIDGRVLGDFLDWEFLTAEDRFVLAARSAEGTRIEFDVERPEGLPLGVELEPPRIRRCANRCDFCFVDGLPEGMRETLYIRDDDYRLSFRYGNFATLTNLKQKDIDRIFEYRLSPLYVSVHATDPVIRRRLLRNPRAPDVRAQLKMFGAGGIRVHTQVVLQPGVNDGIVLRRSLEDLYALGAVVLSVSVVPVGLTEYSKHHLVHAPTAEACQAALRTVEGFATRAVEERGYHWAYGADELFLLAGGALPPPEAYDGFEQVENGVGSVRYLQQQIASASRTLPNLSGIRIGVFTGIAMGSLMPLVLEELATVTGGDFELIVLANDLFGPSVTSAGLLSGRSLTQALTARTDLDLALLPAEAVSEAGLFLDNLSAESLTAVSSVDVRFSYHFADALQEGAAV